MCGVSHLVFQVPSPMPCWSSRERHLLVAWLVLGNDGRITIAFVLVHMLSQCNVGCAGRLFQHGGIRKNVGEVWIPGC